MNVTLQVVTPSVFLYLKKCNAIIGIEPSFGLIPNLLATCIEPRFDNSAIQTDLPTPAAPTNTNTFGYFLSIYHFSNAS